VNFLKKMTTGNVWLWFHILGGGIIAKILLMWFPAQLAFTFTLVIAVFPHWFILHYLF